VLHAVLLAGRRVLERALHGGQLDGRPSDRGARRVERVNDVARVWRT
jgi:hypothetical protein